MDHFGLEKIKRRLIEYLAVVRLKERIAAAETRRAAADAKQVDGADSKAMVKGDLVPAPVQVPRGGRMGTKGVKGPIVLYVFHSRLVPNVYNEQIGWPSGNWQNFPRTILWIGRSRGYH